MIIHCTELRVGENGTLVVCSCSGGLGDDFTDDVNGTVGHGVFSVINDHKGCCQVRFTDSFVQSVSSRNYPGKLFCSPG